MFVKEPQTINNSFSSKIFYKDARSGLRTILNELKFKNKKGILLPDYIGVTDREGSGVFDPVEETGIAYNFYSLNTKLSAIKADLYSKLETKEYSALLIIHYFGFCQNDMNEVAELCRKNGVILIEDCAHSMASKINGIELGSFGDFSIYSLHKYLPTKNGGCLKINNSEFFYLLEKAIENSDISESINLLAKSDLDLIKEKRRANYNKLLSLLTNFKGLETLYPELPEGVAPHNLPVLIKNGHREKLYFRLIENGVPVIALYYKMIVPLRGQEYINARYFSDNILNLPVHQDVEELDLYEISRKLKSQLKCLG